MTNRRVGVLVTGAVLIVGLASCGGAAHPGVATAGNAPSNAGMEPASDDPDQRARQLVACLRGQQVAATEAQEDGRVVARVDQGADARALDAAMTACRAYLSAGAQPDRVSPEDLEKARMHSRCMRDHGVPQFPDPDPETGEVSVSGDTAEAIKTNPKFRDAEEACRATEAEPRQGEGG